MLTNKECKMAIKMLIFDFRDSEKKFFENNKFEDFDITFFKESLNEESVKKLTDEQLEQTAIISVFIDSEITEFVINQFKNLRTISTRSTGIDHINHKICVDKNIDVINVSNYGEKSVAQYTIGLIIALVRKIIPASSWVFNKDTAIDFTGHDISAMTIGVVGTGAIGASVCKLAKSIGMRVLAYDVIQKQELKEYAEYVDFDNIIREADVLTLHLPYTGDNKNMIAVSEFSKMKKQAYLINTSRGEIVDIFALYDALISGEIAGCGLDVLPCETFCFKCKNLESNLDSTMYCMKEAETVEKLAQLPNVIITPHIAYETQEAIDYLLKMTFRGIQDCIQGGSMFKNL